MAKISNTALSDTFDAWRLRTNQLADRVSQFAINNSRIYANTVVANTQLTVIGGASFKKSANVAHNLIVVANTTLGTNPTSVHRFSGDSRFSGRIITTGNVTASNVASRTHFGGQLNVSKTSTFQGNISASNTSSKTHLGGTLNVSKTSTFQGNISASNTSSKTHLGGTLNVSKGSVFLGNVSVSNVSSVFSAATANVNFTGTGKFLVKTANTDIRGNRMLVTSNVVITGAAGITFPDGTAQITAASGGAGAFFNETITGTINANLLSSSMGSIHTFPATAGKRYTIYSMVFTNANTGYSEVAVTAAIIRGANAHSIAAAIPVPGATGVELLKKPKVAYPSDVIRARTNIGTGKMHVTYATEDDTTKFSHGFLLTNTVANTVYTMTAASTLESVLVVNSNTVSAAQITVERTDGSNVNKHNLAYELVIPAQSSVELIDNVQYIESGYKIRATALTANMLRVHIAGKVIS